jgi:tripartite-type tricarboxylate transporter receptor subunit TctC
VDRLHQEILKALQEQKVGEKLAALGVEPMTMTPQDFDAFVSREVGDDAALVQAAGLKPPH